MREVGINLYSIRTLVSNEADFLDTAIKLREMGYTFLQYSGGPYDHEMIARVSNESGLPIILTHVPIDRIISDTEALMEEHAVFGCKNIGLGAMGSSVLLDEKNCKETIEKLNVAGEKMQKNGFAFYYHNHHHEFYKHNGVTVFDYMIENAPYINFTFDTYWAQFGGVSVADYVEKLNGRIGCVHLKDYKIEAKTMDDGKPTVSPIFAPVGCGNIDFKAIVPKMLVAGTKYFIVEQDNAVEFDSPLDQVKKSVDYIKKEL
jgi:sugar phosphate isomerase/epimerase